MFGRLGNGLKNLHVINLGACRSAKFLGMCFGMDPEMVPKQSTRESMESIKR